MSELKALSQGIVARVKILTETDSLPSSSAAWLSPSAHTHTHMHIIDWHSWTHRNTKNYRQSHQFSPYHTKESAHISKKKMPTDREKGKSLLTPSNQVNCKQKSLSGHLIMSEL